METDADAKAGGLTRLIYVSNAAPPLRAADLEAIRARSAFRNRLAGLTGFLLFQRPRFFAVLEGPSRKLFARMEVIATDSRHSMLRVLREHDIAERQFADWALQVMSENAPDPVDVAGPEAVLHSLARRLGSRA